MIAKAFRPVAWVGAIAVAALCCYMLSLKVAAERADLASLEARIVAAHQDIRTLQTELGTRGRLQQLEQWNAEVLALSAPVAGQFVARDVSLARFDTRAQGVQPSGVRTASAAPAPAAPAVTMAPRQAALTQAPDAGPARAAPRVTMAPRQAALTQAPAGPARSATPLVRRASLTTGEALRPAPIRIAARPERAAPAVRRSAGLLDEGTLNDLGRAERGERGAARD